MADISIIIVNWNVREHLIKCLRSLAALNTRLHLETIVVDNASTDGSQDAVQEQFPDVKLLRNSENLGFARGNNIGIKQSAARYICLINSDIIAKDGSIDTMYEYMEGHPSVGLLGPQINLPNGNLQVTCKEFPSLRNSLSEALGLHRLFPASKLLSGEDMTYFSHNEIRKVDMIIGCFWMVRKTAFDEVGPLDEDFFIYSEDVDWCRRAWGRGWEVVYFPWSHAVHHHAASSSNAPVRFYVERHKAREHYWKKHHGPFTRLGFWSITLFNQILRITSGAILYIIRPSEREDMTFTLKSRLACTRWLLGLPWRTR